MFKVKLIADSRESYFLDEVDNYIHDYLKFMTYGVERLVVGDFVIKVDDKIVAIIERKRLRDYADSFNDGRILNQQGLLNMREIHGCEIFYLVEGNFNFDGETVFNGVKYSTINNDIIKLQLIHNVKIIRTGCIKHTAIEILELCKFLALNRIPKHRSVDKLIGVLKTLTEKYSEKPIEQIPQAVPNLEQVQETAFDSSKDIGSDESEITEVVEDCNTTTDKVGSDNIIFSVWKLLIDIDDEKLINLSKIFRLCDWINGLKNDFKYSTEILNIINSDRNMGKLLSPITKSDSIKIMSNVHGISEKSAEEYLSKTTLFSLYNDPKSADITVAKRKFGPMRRKKVIALLENKLN
jgi:ERCC4-type nuclease